MKDCLKLRLLFPTRGNLRMKSPAPEQVHLSRDDVLELQSRISSGNMTAADKSLFSSLLDFNIWLGEELSQARLSIKRLQTLFGVSTEKKSPTPVHPLMQRVES